MRETVRVLVVDDDRRMVKTIRDILAIHGYETIEAFTGEEALVKIAAEHPDCVLMDIKMPGVGGVGALKMIKYGSPELPVLLMSAYAGEDVEDDARRQGAYAVLTKPIDLQMVLFFLSMLKREESVLIVDDDPVFCRTLKELLQARGYEVETETDPDRVLRRMEESYKLVVILDIKLGKANGIEVLQTIRKRYPTKPVVLMTGQKEGAGDLIGKGLRIGAYTCFYKPLETETLIRSIREIRRKKLQNVLGEAF